MKKCPFCAEEIMDEAIKCRYCHEVVTGNPFLMNSLEKKIEVVKVPWYCSWWFIAAIFFTFPPYSNLLSIPLFWLHPRWSQKTKITWTIICLICAAGFWYVEVMVIAPWLRKIGGGEMNAIIQLLGPSLGSY